MPSSTDPSSSTTPSLSNHPTTIQTPSDISRHWQIIRSKTGRSEANSRLVQTFGVDNIFTNTDDQQYKTQFKKDAIQKMRVAKLPELIRAARDARDEFICYHHMKENEIGMTAGTVKLAELTEFVTLKVSLVYLFPGSAPGWNGPRSFENIALIGQRINELWIASKTENPPSWAEQTELHQALREVTATSSFPVLRILARWLPLAVHEWLANQYPALGLKVDGEDPDPLIPRRNPMNWLLPAYETMWRAVMRCVMEIRFRDAANGAAWEGVLRDFLAAPTEAGKFRASGEHGVSALDIVMEILRLYPPSKRVRRQDPGNGTLEADIELCHHSAVLSGSDPFSFRPERWGEINQEIENELRGELGDEMYDTLGPKRKKEMIKAAQGKRGFDPFASHCPAGKGDTETFGMKMIAVLTAVLCEGLEGWERKPEWRLPQVGEKLCSNRESYLGLEVVRRSELEVEYENGVIEGDEMWEATEEETDNETDEETEEAPGGYWMHGP
ncbi:hypothetical protein M011DRAFT_464397 [Sporormia fimetaria CBS 119925]|uniref:Cytochrome P450 n=1 Tax=Sporormia fimetaria CBS 119925 TaxID=1340428 RepID=A0A6A6VJ00_9PLEO|nr:hypothetical protein M011DRAFT_464397 [Sporormia fimetaria CBS 119925]